MDDYSKSMLTLQNFLAAELVYVGSCCVASQACDSTMHQLSTQYLAMWTLLQRGERPALSHAPGLCVL